MSTCRLLVGDVRESLSVVEPGSVQCCVTSPPYWGLRDYGHVGQLGLEATPEEYVANMVEVFREVRRVLRDDGTLWLNLGDSYRDKRLMGIPWKVALALQQADLLCPMCLEWEHGSEWRSEPSDDDVGWAACPWCGEVVVPEVESSGWTLRSEIIWNKPNAMPETATDRPSRSHEHLFLFSKGDAYRYDADAIAEDVQSDRTPSRKAKASGVGHLSLRPGGTPYDGTGDVRNARTVWNISTTPYPGAHFATFPPGLAEKCILAGSKPGDTVLDPFGGSGTTAMVATGHGRRAILCELNPEYADLITERVGPMLMEAA